jgi:predicted AlkP superfamily pyrophosphatase or phosphodiesterase
MADRVVLLSIPQLRQRDVSPGALSSLDAVSAKGAIAELIPPFPGLAASSFATLITGTGPYQHGLIGNTYFDRSTRRIEFPPLPDSALEAPRIWDRLRESRPSARTLLWFAPNSHGATAELSAGVDATWSLQTSPAALSGNLIRQFGPFPKPAPSGEPPRLEATRWILKTAAEAISSEEPDLSIVRIPYLGQVARRFGPDCREAGKALRELDPVLSSFLKALPSNTLTLCVTESVTTPVSAPVFPNQILKDLGLIALNAGPGGGVDIDLERSAAFALADHQLCHVYINDSSQAATIASAFSGAHGDGIATVESSSRRAALGLDHARAGDVVMIASPDRWFSSDWWKNAREAPPGGGVLGASPQPAHVQGSLGAPPPGPEYLGIIVSSDASLLGDVPQFTARDVAESVLRSLRAARMK